MNFENNKIFCFVKNNTIEKVNLTSLENINISHKFCKNNFPCVLSIEEKYKNAKTLGCKNILEKNIDIEKVCNGEESYLPVYDGTKIHEIEPSEMVDFCKIINKQNGYTPKIVKTQLVNNTIEKYIYSNKTKEYMQKINNSISEPLYLYYTVHHTGGDVVRSVPLNITRQDIINNNGTDINDYINNVNIYMDEYRHNLNYNCFYKLQKCLRAENNTEYLNKTNFINKTISNKNFPCCLNMYYNNSEILDIVNLTNELY